MRKRATPGHLPPANDLGALCSRSGAVHNLHREDMFVNGAFEWETFWLFLPYSKLRTKFGLLDDGHNNILSKFCELSGPCARRDLAVARSEACCFVSGAFTALRRFNDIFNTRVPGAPLPKRKPQKAGSTGRRPWLRLRFMRYYDH